MVDMSARDARENWDYLYAARRRRQEQREALESTITGPMKEPKGNLTVEQRDAINGDDHGNRDPRCRYRVEPPEDGPPGLWLGWSKMIG
jgi:hypothetical protein